MDCSGGKTEELVHKTDFACHAGLYRGAMATTDHSHHLEALDCRTRRFHALEATGWVDHALERAVICFDDIVQVLRGPVLDIFASNPSLCKRRMAFGYEASLSVVIEDGG